MGCNSCGCGGSCGCGNNWWWIIILILVWLWLTGGNATNPTENEFHLRRMDYLRLKNIQLGYTVPRKITTKFWVQDLRVYFSADNLVTLTSYEGLDPEKPANSGDLYPTTKTYTVGLNLSF